MRCCYAIAVPARWNKSRSLQAAS